MRVIEMNPGEERIFCLGANPLDGAVAGFLSEDFGFVTGIDVQRKSLIDTGVPIEHGG